MTHPSLVSHSRRGESAAQHKPTRAAKTIAKAAEATSLSPATTAWVQGLVIGLSSSTRCLRCGRALSDDASVARGVGPDCLEKMGGASHFDAWLDAMRARGIDPNPDGAGP